MRDNNKKEDGTQHMHEPLLAGDHVVIAHVSSVHPWTDNRIHFRECASLAALGYEVHLVAVESTVTDVPRTGVHVVSLPRLPRLRRVTIGGVRAIKHGIKTKATVFHLHDPELVWAVPLLRLMGKRVIFDAHEDLPVQMLSKEYLHSAAKPFMKTAAYLAIGLAKLSNHVVAATETIAERFKPDSVSIVHNYPPLREVEVDAQESVDRKNVLVYVGGLGEARGATQMIDALAEPGFPEGWSLEVAGSMSPALSKRLESSAGWDRVTYHGVIGPGRARDLILDSKVGLLLYQDNAAHRDALPTKMFEYFAAGVPVVASDFPLWRTIVHEFDCGILVDETSPSAIAEAIARYAGDPGLLEMHSANARRLALDRLNWAHEVPVLAAVYERVLAA